MKCLFARFFAQYGDADGKNAAEHRKCQQRVKQPAGTTETNANTANENSIRPMQAKAQRVLALIWTFWFMAVCRIGRKGYFISFHNAVSDNFGIAARP